MLNHLAAHALLRTVLLPAPRNVQAFLRWQQENELDNVAAGDYQLLPLVYHKLAQAGVEHPWLSRLRGIYRRTWYANQMNLGTLRQVVQSLQEENVPTLVVGGAALSQCAYAEVAHRPFSMLEVVVPRDVAARSLAHLQEKGWQLQPLISPQQIAGQQVWLSGWNAGKGVGESLRLNWHVVAEWPAQGVDDALWANAIPLAMEGGSAHTLSSTDHLLWVCAAMRHQPLIALVDVVHLIQFGTIEWSRLIEMARACQLVAIVNAVLETVVAIVDLHIPATVFSSLRQSASTPYERQLLKIIDESLPSHTMRGRLRFVWSRFQRIAKAQSRRPTLWAGLTYLRDQLRLRRMSQSIRKPAS